MKTAILAAVMKLMSVDFIARIMAMCISRLLKYASRRGGDTWNKVKSVMKKTEAWISLFNDVYEDDEMTKEEEEKVADAIASMTAVKKLKSIVSGD